MTWHISMTLNLKLICSLCCVVTLYLNWLVLFAALVQRHIMQFSITIINVPINKLLLVYSRKPRYCIHHVDTLCVKCEKRCACVDGLFVSLTRCLLGCLDHFTCNCYIHFARVVYKCLHHRCYLTKTDQEHIYIYV